MKIYVMRHGETQSNLTGIVAGRSEEQLTEHGKQQVCAVCQQLLKEGTKFDAIFASPVWRVQQTVAVMEDCGVKGARKVVFDERLTERDLGKLFGRGYTIDDLWRNEDWNSMTVERTSEGAETLLAGLKRTKLFLDEKRNLYPKGEILVVTHSFISRCMWILENKITKPADFAEFHHANDELRIYMWA